MFYTVIAESDIGNLREVNQDSLLIKHILYDENEVLMAIICDGMGGLSKGELASATLIREFNEWFEKNLLFELQNLDLDVIACKCVLLLKSLNIKIQEYSNRIGLKLGSTFTGILFINNQFIIIHIGDTRVYHINTSLIQLTSDHTFIAREVGRGTLTIKQAQIDKRQNILLQCIGASKTIEPQVIKGETQQGVYLLCSDGLRHKISEEELVNYFNFKNLNSKKEMKEKSKQVIEIVKSRGEKDNISLILIKVDFKE